MGCTQAQQTSEPIYAPSPPKQIKESKKTEVARSDRINQNTFLGQISMENLYIFGVANNNKTFILKFNPKTEILSRIPSNNLDLQVIHFLLKFYNYSSVICIGKEIFFISGGINLQLSQITNKCFIYNAITNQSKPVSKMINIRYTHISTYFQNYVYVFGGRVFGDDRVAILSKCQRYNILKDYWEQIPSMKITRCTGFCLVWKQEIYVFGGYSNQFKRSKTIEIYNPYTNEWRICPFKLHAGLQCGMVLPFTKSNNEFILFGGNMKYGPVDTVNLYNLQQGTVHSRKNMFHPRVLQKGIGYQNNVYVLGGCQYDNVQICNLSNFEWRRNTNIKIKNFLDPNELEKFSHSIVPCVINNGQSTIFKQQFSYNDQIVFLFGTDSQPFILEFNISIPYAVSHPVPLQMKLLSYQGGTAIPGSKFILMGGVRDQLDRVKSNTYQYDTITRKARQLDKMHKPRYAFPSVYNQNYIYVIGGRTQVKYGEGNDILDACQRFNLKSYKWQIIANLPQRTVSAMAFVYKNHIYVTGGFSRQGQRVKNIYVYMDNDYWKNLEVSFPFGLEASSLYWKSKNQLYFFGGRVYQGDTDSVWRMIITQDYSATQIIKTCYFNQVGKLNEPKCLHKTYHPRHQNFTVIFGGENEYISFYDLDNDRTTDRNSDIFSNVIHTFDEEIFKLRDKGMKTYLLLHQTQFQ